MFKTQNLYQNDENWKNVKLGNSSETIGGWGCLLTSAAMMLNGLGYNETPVTVNEEMKKHDGFQGAFFIPSVLPYRWPGCAYTDMQPCQKGRVPVAQIDAAVAAGKPVILQVDWSKQADIQTHFVLVKEKKGDDYVIYDPYRYGGDSPDKEVLLTTRYKYNGGTLQTEISAVLWFDSYGVLPAEPPKVTRAQVPAERYLLYVAEDDLALRAEPSVSGYLWKRMVSGTELISLEQKTSAQGKLGKQGKWIQVQDPQGDQGYVAAWFVSDVKGQTAPTTATPVPTSLDPLKLPPGALAFYPIQELALRSQPVIASETLLRRIPTTEPLVSVEPANVTIPKVGVNGRWLRVRDASNKEGYVAAWYIKYAGGSTAMQTATSTSTASSNGGPIKVKATVEGLALRTEGIVSDTTLIKRLPIGTECAVLEPNAESKIGDPNKWIRVREPGGAEGVVSAWFVTR